MTPVCVWGCTPDETSVEARPPLGSATISSAQRRNQRVRVSSPCVSATIRVHERPGSHEILKFAPLPTFKLKFNNVVPVDSEKEHWRSSLVISPRQIGCDCINGISPFMCSHDTHPTGGRTYDMRPQRPKIFPIYHLLFYPWTTQSRLGLKESSRNTLHEFRLSALLWIAVQKLTQKLKFDWSTLHV